MRVNFNSIRPYFCWNRKKYDSGAGRPCYLLKSQWRMLSVSLFGTPSFFPDQFQQLVGADPRADIGALEE